MRTFRHPLALASCATLALLAACSQNPADREEATTAVDASESSAMTADAAGGALPDFGRAAPGVAFAYSYAFVLPAKAISQVEQEHAAACGKLGADRCRITGMAFDQSGERDARGRLDILIAPELAGDFGRAATGVVEKADGKLDKAEVSGTDAGGAIDQSHRSSADARGEVERIEGRLKVAGLAKETRIELEQRLSELNNQLRSEKATRGEAERSLATTPMHFEYSDQGLLAGGNGFSTAASASWSSAGTALSLALIVAGFVLPWGVLIGLIWLAVIGLRRSRRAAPDKVEAETV